MWFSEKKLKKLTKEVEPEAPVEILDIYKELAGVSHDSDETTLSKTLTEIELVQASISEIKKRKKSLKKDVEKNEEKDKTAKPDEKMETQKPKEEEQKALEGKTKEGEEKTKETKTEPADKTKETPKKTEENEAVPKAKDIQETKFDKKQELEEDLKKKDDKGEVKKSKKKTKQDEDIKEKQESEKIQKKKPKEHQDEKEKEKQPEIEKDDEVDITTSATLQQKRKMSQAVVEEESIAEKIKIPAKVEDEVKEEKLKIKTEESEDVVTVEEVKGLTEKPKDKKKDKKQPIPVDKKGDKEPIKIEDAVTSATESQKEVKIVEEKIVEAVRDEDAKKLKDKPKDKKKLTDKKQSDKTSEEKPQVSDQTVETLVKEDDSIDTSATLLQKRKPSKIPVDEETVTEKIKIPAKVEDQSEAVIQQQKESKKDGEQKKPGEKKQLKTEAKSKDVDQKKPEKPKDMQQSTEQTGDDGDVSATATIEKMQKVTEKVTDDESVTGKVKIPAKAKDETEKLEKDKPKDKKKLSETTEEPKESKKSVESVSQKPEEPDEKKLDETAKPKHKKSKQKVEEPQKKDEDKPKQAKKPADDVSEEVEDVTASATFLQKSESTTTATVDEENVEGKIKLSKKSEDQDVKPTEAPTEPQKPKDVSKFVTAPEKHLSGLQGDTLEIICQLTDKNEKVIWQREDFVISETTDTFKIIDNKQGEHKLIIKNVQPTDSATYSATVGSEKKITAVEIEALPVQFLNKLNKRTVANEEENVSLTVDIQRPSNEVAWFKDGKPIDVDNARYSISQDKNQLQLTIDNVKPDDKGKYTLKVENIETSTSLEVKGKQLIIIYSSYSLTHYFCI